MIIKINNKEIELPELWYRYLYPYLTRFCIKNNISIEWKNDIISISEECKEKFHLMLERVLTELLEECYVEPTPKQRSKHSSRYQKINFKGKLFVLNYRTDVVGMVGYALDYLISEIKK